MSFTPTTYLKEELAVEQRPDMNSRWFFAGIDLAPNEMLETGVVALDRNKTMLRMDKLGSDEQILCFVDSLGPAKNVVVALDAPKNLSIRGRWRQQEIKMFPFRLESEHPVGARDDLQEFSGFSMSTQKTRISAGVEVLEEEDNVENEDDAEDAFEEGQGSDEESQAGDGNLEQDNVNKTEETADDDEAFTNRWAERAWTLYEALNKRGVCVFLYFNHLAKPRYDLSIPFRTRTPRGCKALQAVIRERLLLDGMPTNLAPSSVLDAMVGAYTAWGLYKGQYGTHYRLFWDRKTCMMLEPLKRIL